MRLHFCESCGQQFTSEGDLPPGAALCLSCREKQGAVPPARPGRTNTLLRASTARGSHRHRSGIRASVTTRGTPGLSPAVVWGGILTLTAMIAGLMLAVYLMRLPEQPPKEITPPAQQEKTEANQPASESVTKQNAKEAEAAFDQLLAVLDKLPPGDRATRLKDFVKKYPESIFAPRARTMISAIEKAPVRKAK